MKLYWNYATGGVETEEADNNCPIIKSPHDGGIVIESWWTDHTHTYAIEYAHLRGGFQDRDAFFKMNNVNPQEMRWLMIPKSEYEQLEEREQIFAELESEDEE